MKPIIIILTILLSAPAAFGGTITADLMVSKTGPNEANADTDVAYTVTVSSLGPNAATNITLNDNVPAGMTFVSVTPSATCSGPTLGVVTCTIASLAAGAESVFTFVFHIPAGTAAGTSFTNVATVSSPDDSNEENNSASATTSTPSLPSSDARIEKSGPFNAAPNSDVAYTISVTNNSLDAAATLTWNDTLPGSMTFVSLMQDSGPTMSCTTGTTINCSLSPFPGGTTATFTLTGHIPAGTAAGAMFTNTATATATNDPDLDNNSSSTTLTVSAVDLSISKTGPPAATAGTPFSYTIDVANSGPDVAANASWFDTLPANTTFQSLTASGAPATCDTPAVGTNGTVRCVFGTLGIGASAQFILTITAGNTTSVMNTAIVDSDSFDTNLGNNNSSMTTAIAQLADVSIVKSGPPAVTAGNDITYTVSVSNAGPTNAVNVEVTDPAPANTTFVSATHTSGPAGSCAGSVCSIALLPPNTTTVFAYVFHVSPAAPNGSTIANSAAVTTATPESSNGNNSSSTSATVAPTADLAVTKTGPATVVTGMNLTYNVSLTNNGPSDAVFVVLTDTLPANTLVVSAQQTGGLTGFSCLGTATEIVCTRPSLPAGSTATFEFVLQFNGAPGSTITNSVAARSDTVDPNPGNSTAGAITTAAPPGSGPTLSPFALALLSAALAIAGVFVVRRG